MKTAYYKDMFGGSIEVYYDENAPCRVCGLPIGHASMGGTDVCPYCDCGKYRDYTEINVRELMIPDLLKKKAKEISEKVLNDHRKPI